MESFIQRSLLIVLLGILVPISVFSQKKVLGLPQAFKGPMDVYDRGAADIKRYLTGNTENKDRRTAWIVISDRNDNPVFSSNNLSSREVGKIQFRELFYVVEEKEGWIKIANVSGGVKRLKSKLIEPVGWVPKDRMLLWNVGLVDPQTKINKKAFLLNRAEDIDRVIIRKQGLKELTVDFYSDPLAKGKEKERTIYDFYFVFKKENGMFLLGEDANLSDFNIQSKLLGWVDQRRLQQWNTRICLEPNFDFLAYSEREANKAIQIRGFGKPQEAADFSQSGNQQGVIWDSDPVKFKISEMATSDYKRFKGSVVRFPMFGKGDFGGVEHFKSGVIGSIKVLNNRNGELVFNSDIQETDMAQLKEQKAKIDYKNNNVNLFFVVEGTRRTFAFQQDIVKAIQKASRNERFRNKNVKYGALIYRDIPEKDRITEYKKLTSDLDEITNFIGQADFSNRVDQDDYTALYYGVRQSLKVGGFDKDAINIIVLMGSGGDFSVDQLREKDASTRYPEYLIQGEEKNQIFKNLVDIDAHLYSIQLFHDGRRKTGTAYGMQSWHLILETAKYFYNDNFSISRMIAEDSGKEELMLSEPSMDHPIGLTSVSVKGSKPGRIFLPMKLKSLESTMLESGLKDMIAQSLDYHKAINDIFTENFEGEEIDLRKFSRELGIAAPDLAPGFIDVIQEMRKNTSVDDKVIVESTGLKLIVYTEVYLPLQMKAAKKPPYSYVLFMPELDLLQYQNLINRSISSANFGTYPEKRKSLFEMYLALIEQFAGEDLKNPEDMTREEVLQIMQGIQREGLKLDIELNVRIGDIRDERKVSNQKIDALIQRFNDVSLELEKIIKLNDRFDFCMISDTNNRYYWLKLDQVF